VSGYERAPWLDEADATPREVLTAALGDAGQADAALAALEAAGYAVAAHVWVATLELAVLAALPPRVVISGGGAGRSSNPPAGGGAGGGGYPFSTGC
jgi:hypothetical protein